MADVETLKGVTADELNNVLDADIGAFESEAGESAHIVDWLEREYPELFQFAEDCVSRYFEDPSDADPAVCSLIAMNTAITLGAICKVIEARELPPI